MYTPSLSGSTMACCGAWDFCLHGNTAALLALYRDDFVESVKGLCKP